MKKAYTHTKEFSYKFYKFLRCVELFPKQLSALGVLAAKCKGPMLISALRGRMADNFCAQAVEIVRLLSPLSCEMLGHATCDRRTNVF